MICDLSKCRPAPDVHLLRRVHISRPMVYLQLLHMVASPQSTRQYGQPVCHVRFVQKVLARTISTYSGSGLVPTVASYSSQSKCMVHLVLGFLSQAKPYGPATHWVTMTYICGVVFVCVTEVIVHVCTTSVMAKSFILTGFGLGQVVH